MAMSRKIIILLYVTLMLIVLMMPNQATAGPFTKFVDLIRAHPKKTMEYAKGAQDIVGTVTDEVKKKRDKEQGSLHPLGCGQRCIVKCKSFPTQYYKKCVNLSFIVKNVE